MRRILLLLIIISLFNSKYLIAAPKIQVNAILNNATVLTINGQQQMLRKNTSSKEGYKLVDIGVDSVTLVIDGKSETFMLGAAISSTKKQTNVKKQIKLSRDINGMFYSSGTINKFPVNFLVDTGATNVAINSVLANKIGIDYKRFGKATRAKAASGIVPAWKISLTSVSIGEIELKLVDAVVIEGNFPDVSLLGMSFLSRLKMQDDGLLLTLETKF